MGSAPAGLKPPANGRARSDPLAPQRSRGDRNSRKRTSLLGKLTRGGLGEPLSRREGFHIWPARGHGFFSCATSPQPSPPLRGGEGAGKTAGTFSTLGLPP